MATVCLQTPQIPAPSSCTFRDIPALSKTFPHIPTEIQFCVGGGWCCDHRQTGHWLKRFTWFCLFGLSGTHLYIKTLVHLLPNHHQLALAHKTSAGQNVLVFFQQETQEWGRQQQWQCLHWTGLNNTDGTETEGDIKGGNAAQTLQSFDLAFLVELRNVNDNSSLEKILIKQHGLTNRRIHENRLNEIIQEKKVKIVSRKSP